MAASFVTSSLHLGHIATAMLPLCNNELTERYYHFGLTFVIKQPLNNNACLQKERPGSDNFRAAGLFNQSDLGCYAVFTGAAAVSDIGDGCSHEDGGECADYDTEDHRESERADCVATEDEDTQQHEQGRA